MRIEFKKIEIYNFKSFENEIFEFNSSKNSLNLVCGKNNDIPGAKNGSGKSNLFSALIFSLFGQTKENIKNSNISNKYINSKEVRVATYFNVNSHNYKVVSGHNKHGSPYCQLCELNDDGEEVDLTKSTMSETRKFITEEILHCDLSIFLRTVLLSSDQNYNFFRLRKQDKKEFIEKLFDISIFGDMYTEIHKSVLTYDKTIISHQNKLLILNKNDEEYSVRIDNYNKNVNEKINNLKINLNTFITEKELITSKNIKNNNKEAEKYEVALNKLNIEITKQTTNLNKLKSKKSQLESSIDKLVSLRETKQKFIDKHNIILEKLCKDCQPIIENYYDIPVYLNEINKLNDQIDVYKKSINDINIKITETENKIKLYTDKIAKINDKLVELTKEFNESNKKIITLESKIVEINNNINTLQNTANPYLELYDNNKKDIESETEELKKLTDKYKYLKFAENIVSQDTLRKFIIADLIGLLNNKIKSYLTKFGAKYQVVFDSDMNYTFTTDGGEYEYDNFSSGERARLMIATCFAFRDFMYIRNNFSSNILILDEFIDGAIDSLAIESILEILKDFSSIWNQNIYVISHRKEIGTDIFDNVIQITKENNISTIEYI